MATQGKTRQDIRHHIKTIIMIGTNVPHDAALTCADHIMAHLDIAGYAKETPSAIWMARERPRYRKESE